MTEGVSTHVALDVHALRTWMIDHGVAVHGQLRASPIVGGRSNLTDKVSDDVQTWVLRRPPAAGRSPSAHDVGREYRVIEALGRTSVPVPPAITMCSDPSVRNAPFTLVGYVPGRVLRTSADLDAFDDATLHAIQHQLLAVLADLHAVPYEHIGLATLGRPLGFLQRQVGRWRAQWDHVATRELPTVDRLHRALAARVPQSGPPSIVHGDYRIDNTLLSALHPKMVTAVVDWEMSTLGDPLTDVAMLCVYQNGLFDHIVGDAAASTSGRWPGTETIVDTYAVLTGADMANFAFYLALSYFKLAVIAEGIAWRRAAGAGFGPGFDSAARAVPGLVDAGLDALGGAR